MSYQILQGHVLDRLRELPDNSVHCCVTSPPYWGLRNYGIPDQAWGGDPTHRHSWGWPRTDVALGAFCDCGAWLGNLGLEPTLHLYVEHIVEVFAEVLRVLCSDATLWMNMGDCYANDGKWGGHTGGKHVDALHGESIGRGKRHSGLKPKDLCMIPARVAIALQESGWYLRCDIIWAKKNPMPESVTDRPTKSHEYIFLLSKSQSYYYDADAIREPLSKESADRYKYSFGGSKNEALVEADQNGIGNRTRVVGERETPDSRNKRSVWTVSTAPYSEAHFATFPPKLIEPCILAGCPIDGTVLDPFSGSGTTGMVALRHGRNYIGIELNPEYVEMSHRRITEDQPLLNQEAIA